MQMIPHSFPLRGGLIPLENCVYQQFSLYDHCPTIHLRLKIAAGGKQASEWKVEREDTDLVP